MPNAGTSTTAESRPALATILLDGHLVRRYRVIGTPLFVYEAWAPTAQPFGGPYATITHEGDTWWGRLGSERLPTELEALPAFSAERLAAVRAWQAEQEERAYAVILEAFPEAAGGQRAMGRIEVTWP